MLSFWTGVMVLSIFVKNCKNYKWPFPLWACFSLDMMGLMVCCVHCAINAHLYKYYFVTLMVFVLYFCATSCVIAFNVLHAKEAHSRVRFTCICVACLGCFIIGIVKALLSYGSWDPIFDALLIATILYLLYNCIEHTDEAECWDINADPDPCDTYWHDFHYRSYN